MSNEPLVYLCGTITSDPKYLEWRKDAARLLLGHGIGSLDPVRGKNPCDWGKDGLVTDKDQVIYANGGFVPRDKRDVMRSDALLLGFWEPPDRQSIGTWCEFGWATAWDIPIVVCSELPEVVEHPFIWRQAAKVCATLEEGVEYLAFLLSEKWSG